MQLEWELFENKEFDKRINELTGSEILSQIIANRGFETYEKAYNFLHPLEYKISDPNNFTDMGKAVDRISEAIEKNQNIVICGDFDCDGVTSTAVLYKTLDFIGAKVSSYIPNRKTESHGLNSKAIVEIISQQKAKLIITVDNGISNVSEVKLAKSLGTDIIITDHHEPGEVLPDAYAILNPKCSEKINSNLEFSEIENMTNFAGVMVAYKLCCKLLEKYDKADFKEELLLPVMLGTISDVMPLTNENRATVTSGLQKLQQSQPKWLKKLFDLANKKYDNIESETMAFLVAPRINAAGRLEHATTALQLLVSKDEEEINFCANQLTQFNQTRQQMCETSFHEANIRIVNEINLKTTKAIVLADENWHIGIVGLLASKLVEKYNRPAFIMSVDKEENVARCSIRGLKGLNIHKVLTELSDCFENYGGHELAGGFGADLSKISIKELSRKINQVVLRHLENISLKRKVTIDAILQPQDVTIDFIEKLDMLQPYGEGNRSCTFGMEDMTLKKFELMGNNAHMKLFFESPDKKVFECIMWNKNSHPIELLDVADLTFVPRINDFRGNKTVQLIIKNIFIKNRDIKKKDYDFDENAKEETLLVDHRKKTDYFKMLNSYLHNNKAEVFMENSELLPILQDYTDINSKLKNRFNAEENDELIMLSAPYSEEDFAQLIQQVSPHKVHIFNGNDKKLEIQNFCKMLSGMLKYCSTHNNGIIETEKSVCFLNTTKEGYYLGLELMNDVGVIKIKKRTAENCEFDFLTGKPLSDFLHSAKYTELQNEIERINSFKEEFLTCDLSEIKEMLTETALSEA